MSEEQLLKIVWDKSAFSRLQEACERIEEESILSAQKVKREILKATRELAKQPGRYPPDRYKSENQGNYRAFEIFSFRISYMHTEDEVIILRFQGIKQKPEFY